jgi:uncharacterized protein YbcC (UPF0753/DUF2309 family)
MVHSTLGIQLFGAPIKRIPAHSNAGSDSLPVLRSLSPRRNEAAGEAPSTQNLKKRRAISEASESSTTQVDANTVRAPVVRKTDEKSTAGV